MARALIALLVALLAPLPAAASPRNATIDDAAWLAGRWVGEGLGGQVEEVWSPPAGGQMVGHFRLVRNGAPAFYELCLIDVTADGIRLRVKHFNPDFTGWEERDGWHSFAPVGAMPGQLRFEGLTFRREGDALIIDIRITDSATGTTRDEVLRLRRG